MAEGQAEIATEKSPGDLAREKVAPKDYSWYVNYDRGKPPYHDKRKWLADLQENDPSIVDLQMGLPAFDEQGKRVQLHGGRAETLAAYITRKPPEELAAEERGGPKPQESKLEPTESVMPPDPNLVYSATSIGLISFKINTFTTLSSTISAPRSNILSQLGQSPIKSSFLPSKVTLIFSNSCTFSPNL